MSAHPDLAEQSPPARDQLLAAIPALERRIELAGVSTAVLEGGAGPPVVMLHGPGEFAATWLRVIPDLVTTHRVIAPDLPGHGASTPTGGAVDTARLLEWLGALIKMTCESRPALVGRVLGGAVAARFAIAHGQRLNRLVLVDSLGLAPFAPEPGFAHAMEDFLAGPTMASQDALMAQCAFDFDELRHDLGDLWPPLAAYALDRATDPIAQAALGQMMSELVYPAIPPEDLERIDVPTTLIWGRHDRVTPLAVAEATSARYGWPLHVIDRAADDPGLDRPADFMRVLRPALGISHHNPTR